MTSGFGIAVTPFSPLRDGLSPANAVALFELELDHDARADLYQPERERALRGGRVVGVEGDSCVRHDVLRCVGARRDILLYRVSLAYLLADGAGERGCLLARGAHREVARLLAVLPHLRASEAHGVDSRDARVEQFGEEPFGARHVAQSQDEVFAD